MKFEELLVLLPCHSFEDFPIHHEGEEAEGLLAAWSGMWHPALLAAAEKIPAYCRADYPPDQLSNRLLVVPAVSAKELPVGFPTRAKEAGALVVRKFTKRQELLTLVLAELDGWPEIAQQVDENLIADFLALGYCYLQTELLTRRMRYMSMLDATHFQNQCVAGARAVLQGDHTGAKEKLSSCFSLLAEARAHFYPVDAYLIDLTLVAATTIGESLRTQLTRTVPTNLLVAGEVVAEIAQKQPSTLTLLQAALEQGYLNLVGGEFGEREVTYAGHEVLRTELERGIATYQQHLQRRPTIFGRRKFGLTTAWPGILNSFGFIGALHFALDDGRFPQSERSKTRWEGDGGSAIDAIARVPMDANDPKTFLALSDKMGHTMDSDHVATLVFAHWPGKVCEYYEDLRRMATYAPALGRFITVNEYFQTTDSSGVLSRFEPDEYRTAALQQALIRREADPLSSTRSTHTQRVMQGTAASLQALAEIVQGKPVAAEPSTASAATTSESPSGDQQLPAELNIKLARFAAALPRDKSPAQPGLLLANATFTTRRMFVDVSKLDSLPSEEGSVKAVAISADGRQKHALVEIPPCGFTWVSGGKDSKPAKKAPPLIAHESTLANEFMQVSIHPETGGMRSIHDYIRRGNRLSQQLAMRIQNPGKPKNGIDPDDHAIYSVMALDDLSITNNSSVLGEITTRGRLMHPEGKVLAKFVQRYRLCEASRVLWIDIELEPLEELRSDPWNSYVASRFAWPMEDSDLHRGTPQVRHLTNARRIESPLYVDVQEEKSRTSLLLGGLPYHRRIGLRMLDSMLLVKGETAHTFRLGVGIDLPVTLSAAEELLLPEIAHWENVAPPTPARSGWLFRADVRNVAITHLESWIEAGRVVGFRARILETEGDAGRVNLRCLRPVESAQIKNFLGESVRELVVADDRIQLDVTAHEWVQIEARWKV